MNRPGTKRFDSPCMRRQPYERYTSNRQDDAVSTEILSPVPAVTAARDDILANNLWLHYASVLETASP